MSKSPTSFYLPAQKEKFAEYAKTMFTEWLETGSLPVDPQTDRVAHQKRIVEYLDASGAGFATLDVKGRASEELMKGVFELASLHQDLQGTQIDFSRDIADKTAGFGSQHRLESLKLLTERLEVLAKDPEMMNAASEYITSARSKEAKATQTTWEEKIVSGNKNTVRTL